MKKLLLVFVLSGLFSGVANAQAVKQTSEDPTHVAGHFDIIKMTSKGEEHINVNYALFPAPFTNIVKMSLNTPDPMMMSIKIVNVDGKTKLSWKPNQSKYRYDQQFDIASLSPGLYHMDIFDADNNKVYSVPFTKLQAPTTATQSNNGN